MHTRNQRKVVLDMETGDPDDILTLLFLAKHPDVVLKAVTVTPGTREQVSLVRWILRELNIEDVKIGAQNWPTNADKKISGLSQGFYCSFGRVPVGDDDCRLASTVLCEECDDSTTLLTCGPLHNLGSALQANLPFQSLEQLSSDLAQLVMERDVLQSSFMDLTCPDDRTATGMRIAEIKGKEREIKMKLAAPQQKDSCREAPLRFRVGKWVAQGGFASHSVVPAGVSTLPGFAELETCSTWNFGGNIPAALAALQSEAIGRRVLVSKNVCHQVLYNHDFHLFLGRAVQHASADAPNRAAMAMVHGAMTQYIARKPAGKKMHDPLALAAMLDERVVSVLEVEMYTHKGQWGCRRAEPGGTNTFISVDYNPLLFAATVVALPVAVCQALMPGGWGGKRSAQGHGGEATGNEGNAATDDSSAEASAKQRRKGGRLQHEFMDATTRALALQCAQ